MVLLFACALLFVFIAYPPGALVSAFISKSLGEESKPQHFQSFLFGFAVIAVFLNCWSLFYKVDYISIIPLFLLSCVALSRQSVRHQVLGLSSVFFKIANSWVLVIPVGLLLFLFAIIPPQHGDSGSYHFISIRWIEEFKAVPGLANLHGRFGFNSSFFVTSAAFSFSKLFGQSMYCLNVAVAFSFFGWLINKAVIHKNISSIIYLLTLILLFRFLLIAISSPSPDLATSCIVLFLCFSYAEKIILKQWFTNAQAIKFLLLMAFAVTIKLSAVGVFPLALLLVWYMKHDVKSLTILIGGALLILFPWIVRNYVSTGFLVYPASITGLFSPDWKVPAQILDFDKLLINNGPKLISTDWALVEKMSFLEWVPLWSKNHFTNGLALSLAILLVSVLLLMTGTISSARKRNYRMLLFFIGTVCSIFFWLYNSPDYRFGHSFIIAGIGTVLLYLFRGITHSKRVVHAMIIMVYVACGYYSTRAFEHLDKFQVSQHWLMPMKSSVFNLDHKLSTYRYKLLNEEVKLYIEDSSHNWNLAPLPAYMKFAPQITEDDIELRGNKIEDGFRIRKSTSHLIEGGE